MKGIDLYIFCLVVIVSFVFGLLCFDCGIDNFSEIVTFLSIIIGFKMTSLSILFNSPLKKVLYDRKIELYKTELHRLRDYYRHSIYFELMSVFFVIAAPPFEFCAFNLLVSKSSFVLPIMGGTLFCFYKVFKDLLSTFVYPTNH